MSREEAESVVLLSQLGDSRATSRVVQAVPKGEQRFASEGS